jgi:hypothetical protein
MAAYLPVLMAWATLPSVPRPQPLICSAIAALSRPQRTGEPSDGDVLQYELHYLLLRSTYLARAVTAHRQLCDVCRYQAAATETVCPSVASSDGVSVTETNRGCRIPFRLLTAISG